MANSCLTNYALKGIGYDCNPNLAGVKEVYMTYFDDADVSGAINYSAHTISAVTLSSGVSWYKYSFAQDTSSLNSVLTKDDAAGTRYYTHTIELVFNKLTADKHLEVMALAAEKLAAIIVDNNGKKWYVGADKYVSGTASETGTGASADDRNGYTVTIEGTSAYLPFEFTGNIVAADEDTNG
jgi:hypothetical protein